jgi:DNA-3-methyladenine glycosylase II
MNAIRVQHPLPQLVFHDLPDRHVYRRPDFFDINGAWRRPLMFANVPAVVSVHLDGTIGVEPQSDLPPRYRHEVLSTVNRVLQPVEMPAGALRLLPPRLRRQFREMSPLVQIRSESLFEAVTKAVLRQVIRAAHATQLTDRFISELGQQVNLPSGQHCLFPTPEQVLQLTLPQLRRLGVGFKARTLAAVAEAFLLDSFTYAPGDSIAALLIRLRAISGVGRWSAGVAVSDFLGCWSEYPVDDLAVRTWAKHLWPEVAWPANPELFDAEWRIRTRGHTGAITFYLLTLGCYQSANARAVPAVA